LIHLKAYYTNADAPNADTLILPMDRSPLYTYKDPEIFAETHVNEAATLVSPAALQVNFNTKLVDLKYAKKKWQRKYYQLYTTNLSHIEKASKGTLKVESDGKLLGTAFRVRYDANLCLLLVNTSLPVFTLVWYYWIIWIEDIL
jgi:hypothetical protein